MCTATPQKFEFFQMRNFPEPAAKSKPAILRPEPPPLPPEVLDTDFKKKYPPDLQFGQELDENARVWKVYRDEAIQHDDGMLQAWNNTINILLTFSGLFSAAVTAFVVESYQFLQTGSVGSGSALDTLAGNDTQENRSSAVSPGHPSSTVLFINGLWFTSLFLSLAAAFLCILVKQWLDEYTVRTRASSQNPKHWSRRRAFYFGALDDWSVGGIISVLPVLLHAALFLFFAGMVVLLWSLSRALAAWLSGIGGSLLLLYVISLCLPFWNDACPFATPIVTQVRRSWILFRISLLRSFAAIQRFHAALLHVWTRYSRPTHISTPADVFTPESGQRLSFPFSTPYRDNDLLTPTLRYTRRIQGLQKLLDRSVFDHVLSEDLSNRLDCDALCWLILLVSDNDARLVGFQALGAVTPCSPLAALLQAGRLRHNSVRNDWLPEPGAGDRSISGSARIIRSAIALGDPDMNPAFTHIPLFGALGRGMRSHWTNILHGFPDPHFQLLHHALLVAISEAGADTSDYGYIRDIFVSLFPTNEGLEQIPSLHFTALHLATLTRVVEAGGRRQVSNTTARRTDRDLTATSRKSLYKQVNREWRRASCI